MARLRSLSTRLVVATLATAAITSTAIVGLAIFRVDRGLAKQTAEIVRLSEEKLSQRLDSDARLARARLDMLADDVDRRFAALAQGADVAQAIASLNVVAISEATAPALPLADIDGFVVVDPQARVVGANALTVDLLRANAAMGRSVLAHEVIGLSSGNDRRQPRTFRARMVLDESITAAVGAQAAGALADVMIHPIFDEFGDVIALLVGYRALKASEPTLSEFFQLTSTRIAVLNGGEQVSSAGLDGGSSLAISPAAASTLIRVDDGRYVARCAPLPAAIGARVCALAPSAELHHLSLPIIAIGESQSRQLTAWLIGIVAGSLVLFAAISFFISRQVTRPLVKITAAVRAVADGNWRGEVSGTQRSDEVGDIARAVKVLKRSLEERDRLRVDIVNQNATLVEQETSLREQNIRFDAALNNMSQGLCMFDAAGRLIVSNARFAALYRLEPERMSLGATHREILVRHAVNGLYPAREIERLLRRHETMVAERRPASLQQTLSDERIILITHQPMLNGGWVETHEDVTERKRVEARIAHLARHDALTGLPNRVHFRESLENALAHVAEADEQIAILCVDLDDFKGVNDTLGHPAGDELLKQVAVRLQAAVRSGDTVARLGGDEFALVQSSLRQPEEAEAFAQQVIAILGEPFDLESHQVIVGASIGIAIVGSDSVDPDEILKKADLALYRAKADGRNTHRLFEKQMNAEVQTRRALERDLHQALPNGELEVFYQPLLNLGTGQISGFEALLRWLHPERGFVSPAEFIPIAEEVGLINPIGEWVLRQACAEAVTWPAALKVAVNVSPVQFRNRHLAQTVLGALAAAGLPASRLEIEITESVVLQDGEATRASLNQLRGMGVKLSMDDFGVGYSSLSCLRSYPFDKLKVDRSFVRDMLTRPDCAAIIRTVADLGRHLQMVTTAEGVETLEQLEQLRREGIVEVQGYWISRPVPAKDLPRLISDRSLAGMKAA